MARSCLESCIMDLWVSPTGLMILVVLVLICVIGKKITCSRRFINSNIELFCPCLAYVLLKGG